MNRDLHISTLMLERYHLGEVSAEEKTAVEAALAQDNKIACALADLEESDREIRSRYPEEPALQEIGKKINKPVIRHRAVVQAEVSEVRNFHPGRRLSRLIWAAAAAAVILVIALPLFFILRSSPGSVPAMDRIKGTANSSADASAELSIYLKSGIVTDLTGSSLAALGNASLADETVLHEGNTIQLTYMVNGSGEHYGVIFSIDGRSALTTHYPYSEGQSSRLVTGKQTALDEAYTLDDAPDFEIFFFVVSDTPLDVRTVLESAKLLAQNPGTAAARSRAVFKEYMLKTATVLKG
ncbi:MAG: hypothetical protein LBN21_08955 [Treponema sp.]|jgi:anti-sigma factor RsiW|nr:hypothetical protein [Treponema sp.]